MQTGPTNNLKDAMIFACLLVSSNFRMQVFLKALFIICYIDY